MRRLALLTLATPLLLAPSANAQEPANLKLGVLGLHQGNRTYVVANTDVRVAGTINTAAAGDGVTIELYRKSKRVKRIAAGVNKEGKFNAKVKVGSVGGWAVRVVHKQGVNVGPGASQKVHFTAVRGQLHQGSSGLPVRLLQTQLKRLAYVTPRNGRYSAATARAVLAYRKVNGMARIGSTNTAMMAKLFSGRGGFKLRYPNAGRHVEADLTRQVLVLADHGKAQRIYHTSSGKPSTPTVVGSFRFYMRGPGYNSEGMYYSTYFIRGYAIHGYHSVPAYAASHGCLRVNLADAVGIYKRISLGERIFVYQKGKGSTRIRSNAGP